MMIKRGEREKEREVSQFPFLDSVSWLHTPPRSIQCRSVAKIGKIGYSIMVKGEKRIIQMNSVLVFVSIPVSVSIRQRHYSFVFTTVVLVSTELECAVASHVVDMSQFELLISEGVGASVSLS